MKIVRFCEVSVLSLVLAFCFTLAGCDDDDDDDAGISGTWTGTFEIAGRTGEMTIVFVQAGNNITGDATGTYRGVSGTGTVTGTIENNVATVTATHEDSIVGSGTFTFEGNTMTGTITIKGAGTGTVNLTKS